MDSEDDVPCWYGGPLTLLGPLPLLEPGLQGEAKDSSVRKATAAKAERGKCMMNDRIRNGTEIILLGNE